MRRVIGGKIYDTDTARLLADDTFRDGTNRHNCGRASYLYRTKKGAYFGYYETCWQGEHDRIEPMSTDEAVAMYEWLNDRDAMVFEEAFPDVAVEEA